MSSFNREQSGNGPGHDEGHADRHADTHWSAQAEGWAEHWARLADPAREAVAAAVGIGPGTRLLDVGCGSGEFCALADGRGAAVSGIDAGGGMIRIAHRRLPLADLRVGEAERLPWDANSFDVVTAFNSLQFADDFLTALGEMRRAARPGGLVAVCNWGRREDCELKPIFDALDDGQPPAIQDSPPLGEPGELERLARESGLEPVASADVDVPYETPDRDTLCRALLVDAGLHGIEEGADEAVRAAVERAAQFRRTDGSYRFENRFRYIVAAVGN